MKRVEEFETWETAKKREIHFIRTTTGAKSHQIYYLPKEHNEGTLNLLEASMEAVEQEIKETKDKFEEELIKIEEKLKQGSRVRQIFSMLKNDNRN